MKFYIKIILLLLSSNVYADWVSISKTSNKEFLIEKESHERVDSSTIRSWVLVNYKNETEFGVKSTASFTEFDCANKSYQDIVTIYYDDHDRKGNVLIEDRSVNDVTFAAPDSNAMILLNHSCKLI